jgi:hypothetical protein
MFETVAKAGLKECFGTKELNMLSGICKSCDQLEECKEKAKL